jgi:hypothetical protein
MNRRYRRIEIEFLRLLISDGQEDTVIDGDGTLEESRRIAS